MRWDLLSHLLFRSHQVRGCFTYLYMHVYTRCYGNKYVIACQLPSMVQYCKVHVATHSVTLHGIFLDQRLPVMSIVIYAYTIGTAIFTTHSWIVTLRICRYHAVQWRHLIGACASFPPPQYTHLFLHSYVSQSILWSIILWYYWELEVNLWRDLLTYWLTCSKTVPLG